MTQLFEHPLFEADQVLTANHLNDSIDYLTQQDLLTRQRLLGIGIACGLEVSSDGTSHVTISSGVGVTSQGYLVHLDTAAKLEYYRAYEDQATTPYNYFQKDSGDQYQLWELLTTQEYAESDDTDIYKLEGNASFNINDMAIIVYLELVEKDLRNCIGEDCEQKGMTRIYTLRKLLLNQADLRQIIKTALKQPSLNEAGLKALLMAHYELPDVNVERFSYNIADKSSLNHSSITVLSHFKTSYGSIIVEAGVRIGSALKQTYEVFEQELSDVYGGANPFEGFDLANPSDNPLISSVLSAMEGDSIRFQYGYNFIKDLKAAYDEFLSIATRYQSECCPDPALFPFHLMLNKAVPSEEKTIYRHYFQPSPILVSASTSLALLQASHYKIKLMVDAFQIHEGNALADIRVTPSKTAEFPLSMRSAGFYYNFTDEFIKHWNFQLHRPVSSNTLLSYFGKDYSSLDHVKQPWLYSFEQYGFFRIEGHVGQDYDRVLEYLKMQIYHFNMPFDVLGVKLSRDASDIEIDKSCFDHINVLYKANRDEYVCSLDKLHTLLGYFLAFKPTVSGQDDIDTKKSYTKNGDNLAVSSIDELFTFIEVFQNEVKNLQNNLPECITHFKPVAFTRSYILVYSIAYLLSILIDVLLHLTVDSTKDSVTKIRAFVLIWLKPYFSHLVDDCTDKKFLSIYKSYQEAIDAKRKAQLFLSLAQSMPGYEHLGGVNAGGTFVLVYDHFPEEDTTETGDTPDEAEESDCFQTDQVKEMIGQAVYLSYRMQNYSVDELYDIVSNQQTSAEKAKANYANESNGYTGEETDDSQEVSSEELLKDYDSSQDYWGQRASQILEDFGITVDDTDSSETKEYRVVADFALPYRCCDHCAEEVEIETELSIALQKTDFCKSDPTKYPVAVSPSGGVVLGEGILSEDGVYYFAPSKITVSTEEIKLTYFYEERSTSVVVNVYQPVAAFQVNEGGDDGSDFVLVNQSEMTDYIEWYVTLKPTGKTEGPVSSQELRLSRDAYDVEVSAVEVKLIAYRQGCQSEEIQELFFEDPIDVSIGLDETEFCGNDEGEYAFSLSPEGGVLSPITEVVQKDGAYVFIPKDVAYSEILFSYTVENTTEVLEVKIYRPVANFVEEERTDEYVKFVYSPVSSIDGLEWFVDGESKGSSEGIIIYFQDVEESTFTVELRVDSGPCSDNMTLDVEKPVAEPVITFDVEQSAIGSYQYCNNDEGVYAFTTTPSGGSFTGTQGVSQSEDGYSFSPYEMTPGSYTYSYEGQSIQLEVLDAGTSAPTYSATVNQATGTGLVVLNHLPEAEKVVWKFENGYEGTTDAEVTVFSQELPLDKEVSIITYTAYLLNGCEVQGQVSISWSDHMEGDQKAPEKVALRTVDELMQQEPTSLIDPDSTLVDFQNFNIAVKKYLTSSSGLEDVRSGTYLQKEGFRYQSWLKAVKDAALLYGANPSVERYLSEVYLVILEHYLTLSEQETKDKELTSPSQDVLVQAKENVEEVAKAGFSLKIYSAWPQVEAYYEYAFQSKPVALMLLKAI